MLVIIMDKTVLIKNGINIRDLGGLPAENGKILKYKKVLRSGKLENISNIEFKYLIDKYNLSLIVDLRTKKEISNHPDSKCLDIKYLNIPVSKVDMSHSETGLSRTEALKRTGYGKQQMLYMYRNLITSKYSQKKYHDFFENILSVGKQKSVLFHCTAGKDRTGLASIYLLNALGIKKEAIKQDYLDSNKFLKDYLAMKFRQIPISSRIVRENLMSLWSVNTDYYDFILKTINDFAGNIDNYLSSVLGLNFEIKSYLRERFLQ